MHYYRAVDNSSPSLQHFKYIRRYKKNGKWRYVYPTPKILDTSDYDNSVSALDKKKKNAKKALLKVQTLTKKKSKPKVTLKSFINKELRKNSSSSKIISYNPRKEKQIEAAVKSYLNASHEAVRSVPSGEVTLSLSDAAKKKTKKALSKIGIEFKD